MTLDRSSVVSSFTIIKGAMIPETYEVLANWDFALSKRANLDRLRDENYIGAGSSTWLRDVAKVLNRRLEPDGRDRSLAVLARGGFPIDEWSPLLLWHITRDEFLLRDFLEHWLYEAFEDGAFRIRPEELHDYLANIADRGGQTEHAWMDTTLNRVASGLLKMAADFGLLRGGTVWEFAGYHLPERSLLYLLHAIREQEGGSPRRLLDARDWRMYLLRPSDVEHEILRLHQFKALDYQVAGSLVQIELPAKDAASYAEELVAWAT